VYHKKREAKLAAPACSFARMHQPNCLLMDNKAGAMPVCFLPLL